MVKEKEKLKTKIRAGFRGQGSWVRVGMKGREADKMLQTEFKKSCDSVWISQILRSQTISHFISLS